MRLPSHCITCLAVLLAAGCTSRSKGGHSNISTSVGTTGATLTITNGPLAGLALAIPAGALPGDTNITVDVDAGPASAGLLPVGAAGLFGPAGTSFTPNATLTMHYDASLLPAGTPEAAIVLVRRDSGGAVTVLPSVVDAAADKVTAQIPGFSVYQPQVLIQAQILEVADYFPSIGIDYDFQNDLHARTIDFAPPPFDATDVHVLELSRTAGDADDGAIGFVFAAPVASLGLQLLGVFDQNATEQVFYALSQAQGTIVLSEPQISLGTPAVVEDIPIAVHPFGSPTRIATGMASIQTVFTPSAPVATPVGTFDDVLRMDLTLAVQVGSDDDVFTVGILLARDVGPVALDLPGEGTSLLIGGL